MSVLKHLACVDCRRWVPAGAECPGCGADEVFRAQGTTCLHPPEGWLCWHCSCPIDTADTSECPNCRMTLEQAAAGMDTGWVSVAEVMRQVKAPADPGEAYRERQRWLEGRGQMRLVE